MDCCTYNKSRHWYPLILLNANSDANIVDSRGETPLKAAVALVQSKMAEVLVTRGDYINALDRR